jgi:hypothetical protein
METADRVSRLAGGLLEPVVNPIYSSRLFSPLRNRIDHLAQRGQSEVDRWIEVGRKEERLGRELASTALSEQVDHSIEYLTSNDEVQELVQSKRWFDRGLGKLASERSAPITIWKHGCARRFAQCGQNPEPRDTELILIVDPRSLRNDAASQ